MAYGYNDGDQRPQSVRLAGRTTPTPRSTSDNDNPQRPQEQLGASSRQQSRTVQQSDRMSTSHANARPTHRSHAATIAVRPTTTLSAPFRDLNAIAAIPPLAPRRTPQVTRFRPAAYALRFAPSPPASSLCFWDPVSLTDQPVSSPLPRTSCLKLPSHPVTPLRSRPHARSGRPAPCPTSTKLTPHGRSCPMPVALFAKTLAVPLASPWSTSIRPAAPI